MCHSVLKGIAGLPPLLLLCTQLGLLHVLLYVTYFPLKCSLVFSQLLTQLCTPLGHLLLHVCYLLTKLLHSGRHLTACSMHLLYGLFYLRLTIVG